MWAHANSNTQHATRHRHRSVRTSHRGGKGHSWLEWRSGFGYRLPPDPPMTVLLYRSASKFCSIVMPQVCSIVLPQTSLLYRSASSSALIVLPQTFCSPSALSFCFKVLLSRSAPSYMASAVPRWAFNKLIGFETSLDLQS